MKKILITTALSINLLITQACLPLVAAGGVAAGAFVGSDPRTAETIKNDTKLYGQINKQIGDAYPNGIHVTVTVLEGKVLYTGEVPNEAAYRRITDIAKKQALTQAVYNQTRIGPATGLGNRAHDSGITTRVKTALLASGFSQSIHIKVLTERGTVYLIGKVPHNIADKAADTASKVQGVEKVVRFFEYAD